MPRRSRPHVHVAGILVRLFGATPSQRPIAIAAPSGAQLYTLDGPDVAVWCR